MDHWGAFMLFLYEQRGKWAGIPLVGICDEVIHSVADLLDLCDKHRPHHVKINKRPS